jgi:hypothetical protein
MFLSPLAQCLTRPGAHNPAAKLPRSRLLCFPTSTTTDSCISWLHSTVPALHPARFSLRHGAAPGPWLSPRPSWEGRRVPLRRALDGASGFCIPALGGTSAAPPTTNRTWTPWTEEGLRRTHRGGGVWLAWRVPRSTPTLPVGTAMKLLGAGAELGQSWMRSSFPPCPCQRYGGGDRGHLGAVEEGGRGRTWRPENPRGNIAGSGSVGDFSLVCFGRGRG